MKEYLRGLVAPSLSHQDCNEDQLWTRTLLYFSVATDQKYVDIVQWTDVRSQSKIVIDGRKFPDKLRKRQDSVIEYWEGNFAELGRD